jgi:hypothetical protein
MTSNQALWASGEAVQRRHRVSVKQRRNVGQLTNQAKRHYTYSSGAKPSHRWLSRTNYDYRTTHTRISACVTSRYTFMNGSGILVRCFKIDRA